MRALLALATLLTACGGATDEGRRQDAPPLSTRQAPGPEADAGGASDCVNACVQARQMEARAIEAIRADCAEACAAETGDQPER